MAIGLHRILTFPFHLFIQSTKYSYSISQHPLCNFFSCYLLYLPASSRIFFQPYIEVDCRMIDACLCHFGSGLWWGIVTVSVCEIGPLKAYHGGLLTNRSLFTCQGECVRSVNVRCQYLHLCIFWSYQFLEFQIHLIIFQNSCYSYFYLNLIQFLKFQLFYLKIFKLTFS